MPLLGKHMTRREAAQYLRQAQANRGALLKKAADTRLPNAMRYAAAVYVDAWEEKIEDVRAYLRTPGLQ